MTARELAAKIAEKRLNDGGYFCGCDEETDAIAKILRAKAKELKL